MRALDPATLTRADRWILTRLDVAIHECDVALGRGRPAGATWPMDERFSGLRLDAYAESARRFVWNELADWYVEAAKPRILAGGAGGEVARAILAHAFDQALRLLHPVMPFITESLWQRLPGREHGAFLAQAAWPRVQGQFEESDDPTGARFALVKYAVEAIRSLRAAAGLAPGVSAQVTIVPYRATGPTVVTEEASLGASARDVLSGETTLVGTLSRAAVTIGERPNGAALREACAGFDVYLSVANLPADLRDRECRKARTESEQLAKQLASLTARLANESFTSRAKPEIVAAERQKEREWTDKLVQLREKVATLCG